MFVSSLALLAFTIVPALAQQTLTGTWSSGSQRVVTGSGFVNPGNMSFSYPKTTGISYSFTADGHYEIARYRMGSNGSYPQCITGVMNWVHGTYTQNDNGSLTMHPFGDGFQQIQAPCAAVSNFMENYNLTELYQGWAVNADPIDGPLLQLYQFDGSPLAPMFLVSTSPNMLPTQALRNASLSQTSQRPVSGAPPIARWTTASVTAVGGLLVGVLLVFA